MHTIDVNAQYSIFGSPVQLVHVDGQVLVLHAPHRLGPGRSVSIRSGSAVFQATVESAHIVALNADLGATYELRVEAQGSDSTSRAASPAVEPESPKKGGHWRAA